MNTLPDQPHWSRQVVNPLPDMCWAKLQQGARPWLWLNGAHSETLEKDVLAITRAFNYRWVWRDTAVPFWRGLQHGPADRNLCGMRQSWHV